MTVFIYGLYDPRNGLLRYIGKTNNLKVRHSAHSTEKGENHKHNWVKALSRLGLRPELRVLETIENSNDEDWQERERLWIASSLANGDALTNLHSGGRGGFTMRDETKEKIRAKAIGRKLSHDAIEKMKATKRERMTPEVRRRLGDAQRGKKQSAETIRKRSEAMKGRTVSEETRRKISESNKLAKPRKPKPPRIPKVRAPISEETRAKMRNAALNRTYTPEGMAALRANAKDQTGRKRSPETCAKISEAKRQGWERKKALAQSM